MKKLIFTFCLFALCGIQLFSCTLPWYSTCEKMNKFENVLSGVISEASDNGVTIEVLEVFKGTENRAFINIWDGDVGDCNGVPETAFTRNYGEVGDTLIFALSAPFQSVRFNWDVAGGYRKPVNFFYYPYHWNPEFKKVKNNMVIFEVDHHNNITYSYDEMVAYVYSGECVTNVPKVFEPFELEIVQNAIINGCTYLVYAFEFRDDSYIYIDNSLACEADGIYDKLFNCNDDITCTFGIDCEISLLQIGRLVNDPNIIWKRNECTDPLQLDFVQQSIDDVCVDEIYSFDYENETYIYSNDICGSDDLVYICSTDEHCSIESPNNSPPCNFLPVEVFDLLTEENLIWSAPCNYEYKGIVKTVQSCGPKIDLDNGESIEPQDSDFDFQEGQQVVLSFSELPYNSNCSAIKAVKIICIREVEATSTELFEKYNWLNNLFTIENCIGGTTIIEYDYLAGNFKFIHVTKPSGKADLYFQDGTLFCSDTRGYSCIEAYNLTPTGNSWICDNPVILANGNELFDKYSWVNNLIDPVNCSNANRITEYDSGTYSFVFVENSGESKLYFEDGTFYCSNSPVLDCLALYGLSNATASWACENIVETCLIEGPLNLSWVQELIREANSQTQYSTMHFFSDDENSYIKLSGGSLTEETFVFEMYDCNGTRICKGDNNFIDANSDKNANFCFYKASFNFGSIIWTFDQNEIFNIYPWLNMLINQNNCDENSLQVYSYYDVYEFIVVENNGSRSLYFQDGTLYCTDTPNYSCIEAYGLDTPKNEWTCGGVNQKPTASSSSQKINFDIDFKTYPNPNNGQFTVEFNSQNGNEGQLNIQNIAGRLIQSIDIESNKNQVEIDLSDKAKGIYIVQLKNNTYTKTQRFIIQ